MNNARKEINAWRGILPTGAWNMLLNVVQEHPRSITHAELGARLAMDPLGDTFIGHLRRLTGNHLVEIRADGIVYRRPPP